jgi:myo-inositol catabolism protein IolS
MNDRHPEITRRALLLGGAAAGCAGLIALALRVHELRRTSYNLSAAMPAMPPETTLVGTMPYRRFGRTGLQVSEVGFGAWGIGGTAYGTVERTESLRALARAQELGCNFVDTAMIYGDSELVLGEFLRGRRSRWIVATKYSYQPAGMTATLEEQLRRLGTDVIDFYQLHWQPPQQPYARFYDELYQLKKSGKVRFVGLSLYSASDIDYVIDHTTLDGVQIPFSLLDPDPFLLRMDRLRRSGLAVLIRSVLKEGFLTGKFKRNATFKDPNDQRHSWSASQIAQTVDSVERFRFLEADVGTMVRAAVAYPLSFPEVSTVLLGTKTLSQAEENFGQIPGTRLSATSLHQVAELQEQLDAGHRRTVKALVKRLLGSR